MGHPWVYRSEIGRVAGAVEAGGLVRVVNHAGSFIGIGYYNPQSQIVVRLMTRQDEEINAQFLARRVQEALSLRQKVVGADSNSFRLVYGEADYLPGLTVDVYDRYLSVQVLTLGMERLLPVLLGALTDVLNPEGVVLRNDVPVRELEGLEQEVRFHGRPFEPMVQIRENGFSMWVDLWEGQKTGYFLDQRENRAFIRPFAEQATVLDCFSHTGSFAVHAAGFAASSVTAVDISDQAVSMVGKNAALNGFGQVIMAVEDNAFDYLRREVDAGKSYDVVMLDPPAFTKSRSSVSAARRGYKEINLRGLKLVREGGYLVTSSCSYHISRDDFMSILTQAAADAHRQVKVVAVRGQASDHPVLLAAQETSYLKFVVLQVF
jgi:23S rRNA (cytosine1962-C5)-methyltransferase